MSAILEFVYDPSDLSQKPKKKYYIPNGRPRGGPKGSRTPDRDAAIAQRYKTGATLEEIGVEHKITRERVRQVLVRHGLTKIHGGARVKRISANAVAAEIRTERKIAYDAQLLEFFGCSRAEIKAINGSHNPWAKGAPRTKAFINQKRAALNRGIEWKLNLLEWWKFWSESGFWMKRGRGANGYVMGRLGDSGAYELGNIKIISNVENASESFAHSDGASRRQRATEMAPTKYLRAYHLKMGGLSNTEIAERLNLTTKVASQYICQGRKDIASLTQPTAGR